MDSRLRGNDMAFWIDMGYVNDMAFGSAFIKLMCMDGAGMTWHFGLTWAS